MAVMTFGKWPRIPPTLRAASNVAVVYALLDHEGTPLYVGQSETLITRLQSHRNRTWFKDVRYVTWHSVPRPRWDRHAWEAEAIVALCPTHNIALKLTHGATMGMAEGRLDKIEAAIRYERPMSQHLSFMMWQEDIFRRALLGSRWRLFLVDQRTAWHWEKVAA